MKTIYVGNLSFQSTEAEIESLFAPYGAVNRVSLIKDKISGQSRGFAFVEMDDDGEAQAAIEGLNGTQLGGRSLKVNEAQPQQPRRMGGGGGGGGGGRPRGRGRM